MDQNALRELFDRIRKTMDPAAGSANELLIQLNRRGEKGFRFRSEEQARANANVDLLLNMGIAVWEEIGIAGIEVGGKIRINPRVAKTRKTG